MNKENIEKLINIINLLDKISENKRDKNNYGEHNVNKSLSSELSKTLDSLEYRKSLFPLCDEKEKVNSNVNKIISNFKTTKSFFYFNKSSSLNMGEDMDENMDENMDKNIDKNIDTNMDENIYSNKHLRKNIYLLSSNVKSSHIKKDNKNIMKYTNNVNINDNDIYLNTNQKNVKYNYLNVIQLNEKKYKRENSFSSSSTIFSFIKLKTDNVIEQRNTSNVLRNYFSDTELLSYNNNHKSKYNLLKMLKRDELKKYEQEKFKVQNKGRQNQVEKEELMEELEDGCIDNNTTGLLLEKIIEHLNINLKHILNNYKKEINKLCKLNDTLSGKLENALENNDEQAQEIRDLNKKIHIIKEQKTEMNKIIEDYEFQTVNRKKLENSQQNYIKERDKLDDEIKYLKNELNMMKSTNLKIKEEKLLLKDKFKKYKGKFHNQKEKLQNANELILELKLAQNEQITEKNLNIINNEYSKQRDIFPYEKKRKIIINRFRSDTIMDNFERMKKKLFESNKRCYILSKTNLQLFKGIRNRKKKIYTMNREMSNLKHILLKGKEGMSRCTLLDLKENTAGLGTSNSNVSYNGLCKRCCKLKDENDTISEKSYNNKICNNIIDEKMLYENSSNFDLILNRKNNEYNLLKDRYDVLYKKYIKLLTTYSCKNEDFTFIKTKTQEEMIPKKDVFHSFYVKNTKNNIEKCHSKDNKLISYIKAKVVNKKDICKKKFKHYTESNNYRDLEFYISNQILNKLDMKDILNIRYVYSYGNKNGSSV
ncbi:hypothetical protein PFFVO_02816 [Plasmodium falciparum Vietnam Oak-Knoll (FVO)]|uniref:Uncharacterized protein n=1 Tax=Plasmodium falciparum Vietnam Oak-Knoll (FVO) TaxID=1036723 RepID=A0A024V7X7_PLAFA|nr:hypothetical protein PFFVO_02816 [Plasmodium falciparum Vietnam Oak-Knoll (FVO)]